MPEDIQRAGGRVEVGRLVKAFGLRGELVVIPAGRGPSRFAAGSRFFLGESGDESLVLAKVRSHDETLLLRFEGIGDRTEAERFVKRSLYQEASDLPVLEPGEYYHFQLEGLRVTRADETELGRVRGVLDLPGNDLVEVVGEAGEWLIPLRKEFIAWVDLEKGEIRLTDRGDLLQAQAESPPPEPLIRRKPSKPQRRRPGSPARGSEPPGSASRS